jgi:nitrogen fixation protein FixH
MNGPKRPRQITGRTVLIALLAFFAVVATVNAIFIVSALRTHPGLSEDNAYQAGLAYNRVLADAEAQRALGWRLTLDETTDGRLAFRLGDRHDDAVIVEAATAQLRRPGRQAADRVIALVGDGPGLWHAPVADLTPGNWDVHVEFMRAGASVYRAERRILITQAAPP